MKRKQLKPIEQSDLVNSILYSDDIIQHQLAFSQLINGGINKKYLVEILRHGNKDYTILSKAVELLEEQNPTVEELFEIIISTSNKDIKRWIFELYKLKDADYKLNKQLFGYVPPDIELEIFNLITNHGTNKEVLFDLIFNSYVDKNYTWEHFKNLSPTYEELWKIADSNYLSSNLVTEAFLQLVAIGISNEDALKLFNRSRKKIDERLVIETILKNNPSVDILIKMLYHLEVDKIAIFKKIIYEKPSKEQLIKLLSLSEGLEFEIQIQDMLGLEGLTIEQLIKAIFNSENVQFQHKCFDNIVSKKPQNSVLIKIISDLKNESIKRSALDLLIISKPTIYDIIDVLGVVEDLAMFNDAFQFLYKLEYEIEDLVYVLGWINNKERKAFRLQLWEFLINKNPTNDILVEIIKALGNTYTDNELSSELSSKTWKILLSKKPTNSQLMNIFSDLTDGAELKQNTLNYFFLNNPTKEELINLLAETYIETSLYSIWCKLKKMKLTKDELKLIVDKVKNSEIRDLAERKLRLKKILFFDF